MFYKQQTPVLVQKQSLPFYQSKFKDGRVSLQRDSIKFVFVHDAVAFQQETLLHFTIMNRLNSGPWTPPDLEFNATFSNKMKSVAYDCPNGSEFCKRLKPFMFNPDTLIDVQYWYDDGNGNIVHEAIPLYICYYEDYTIVQAVTCVIGGAILVVCVILVINELVKLKKTVKAMKKSKK